MAQQFRVGDLVEAIETTSDVTQGRAYRLTGVIGNMVEFLDDADDMRCRRALNYRLVVPPVPREPSLVTGWALWA